MRELPRVFVSYARRDGEEQARDLSRRIENAGIPVWRDREGLRGGEGWWSQIELVLDQVEFSVVVLTPAAIASRVVQMEWDVARRKGVGVFPVIASKELDWEAMPIWMQKTHCYDLDHQKAKFINDLNTRYRPTRVPFMVGDLPPNYVARSALLGKLICTLIDRQRWVPRPVKAALRGAGGFGKTVLLQALCQYPEIRKVFFDGILWVTLGERPDRIFTTFAGRR